MRLALAAILAVSLAAGAALRISQPREAFCGVNDELSELMPGLRVHALPLANVRGDIRENFFASLFYSPHGLGDAGYYYLVSGALAALRLPVSDTNLWCASAVTCALLAALIALIARHEIGVAGAIVGICLVAFSPLYLFASHTAFGRVVATAALQMAALLAARRAAARPQWPNQVALFALVLTMSLGDGFFVAPIVVLYIVALQPGSWSERLRRAPRHRAVQVAAAALVLGIGADLAMAVIAARRGAPLTLFGYLRIRAVSGNSLAALDLARLFFGAFDKYLPLFGALAVMPAWLLAVGRSRSHAFAAVLAMWLFVAAVGVLRYYNSAAAVPSVGGMTAYPLALPSYLVVAWALGTLMQSARRPVRIAACLAAVAILVPMAVQAYSGKFDHDYRNYLDYYANDRERCLVVKAAGALVREDHRAGATVFHLADDVTLGMLGEFYYGLSYVGNHRTGERNRILDYGDQMVGRRYTPEQLAAAYGVDHFTYYVEFLTTPSPFTDMALDRLRAAGAAPTLTVTDGAREIGRVWQFDGRAPSVIDRAQIAGRWNAHAQLHELFLQPLAGTSYHFGASWSVPGEK